MSATQSPIVKSTLDWVAAMNARDFSVVGNLLSDSYVHEILPKSLGAPIWGKSEYIAYMESLKKQIDHWNVSQISFLALWAIIITLI